MGSINFMTLGQTYGSKHGTVMPGTEQYYLPFGEMRGTAAGALNTEHGFTGQMENSYIKLVDMRARWYDPKLGQFISADTIVPNPTNLQSFNRYAYVGNNPVNLIDPMGHSCANPQNGFEDRGCAQQEYEMVSATVVLEAEHDFVVYTTDYRTHKITATPHRTVSTSLGTIIDSRYIVTHDHFFGSSGLAGVDQLALDNPSLTNSYFLPKTVSPSNLSIVAQNEDKTLILDWGSNTLHGYGFSSAEFLNSKETTIKIGDEVGIVMHKGGAVGPYVVWTTITEINSDEIILADQSAIFGDSGGGIFHNGIHIANIRGGLLENGIPVGSIGALNPLLVTVP